MKKYISWYLLSFVFLFCSGASFSANSVGSLMTYECQGPGSLPNTNIYKVTLKVFYECTIADSYERTIDLGIYKGTGNNYTFYSKVIAVLDLIHTAQPDSRSCASLIHPTCVNAVTYSVIVRDLPIISENYLISFEKCCRSITVSNIRDPGLTGSTMTMLITPEGQRYCNSSPQFEKDLPLQACLQEDLLIDLRGTDAENDPITYELCAPLTGGGPKGIAGGIGNPWECDGILPDPTVCLPSFKNVNFSDANLTDLNPFPSSIPFTLVQGILRAKLSTTGQFVFGICIKEFRNGLLLTVQRWDIQINVEACDLQIKATIFSNKIENGIPTINHCDTSSPVKIINLSQDSAFIKKVNWEFTGPSGKKIIDSTFHFIKKVTDPGTYYGTLFINRGYNCSDSVNINLIINPLANFPSLQLKYDSCSLAPVNISVSPIDSDYLLDYGDSSMDTIKKGNAVQLHTYINPGSYTLTLKSMQGNDADCQQVIKKTIRLYSMPLIDNLRIKDTLICYPGIFQLATNETLDTNYQYLWQLSDGRSFSGTRANISFTAPQNITISLIVSSAPSCKSQKTFESKLVSIQKPKADFHILNDKVLFNRPLLELANNSLKAEKFSWNFGDLTHSDEFAPTHTYTIQGVFKVTLHATNIYGCTDSLSKFITIGSSSEIYIPNIFTPNADGQNDLFLPIPVADYKKYDMNIFNRWGGLIYASSGNFVGWDGNDMEGHPAPVGVYVCKLKLYSPNLPSKIIYGSISLLR